MIMKQNHRVKYRYIVLSTRFSFEENGEVNNARCIEVAAMLVPSWISSQNYQKRIKDN